MVPRPGYRARRRGLMVARLVRIGRGNVELTRGVLPHDVPAARKGAPDGPGLLETRLDGKPARAKHAARHARTSRPSAPQHASLSIRSAERRRWSADLTRPDVTAVVVHGLGGIGKSTLAAQIAARVSRLAPERAETDLVVLDNFDDNLACEAGLRTIRDPALAAVLASWTGKLLITCGPAFTMPTADRDRFVFRHLG